MRIAVSSDLDEPAARLVVAELHRRGSHTVIGHGALRAGDREDWAWSAESAARCVVDGQADQAVACWTGTGASIAAGKVPGVRAARCVDACTAHGARRWNDADVLAISLRLTSEPLLKEILDAWPSGAAGTDEDDRVDVAHLVEIR